MKFNAEKYEETNFGYQNEGKQFTMQLDKIGGKTNTPWEVGEYYTEGRTTFLRFILQKLVV